MCQMSSLPNCTGGGMSAGLPRVAPPSAHFTIVATSVSVSDGSLSNLRMPTVRSMYQGGISREATFWRMLRTHGRTSSYVRNDIGAIESGRWHFWQERCKIGATSLVKVTVPDGDDGVCAESCQDEAATQMAPRITGTDAKRFIRLPPHSRAKLEVHGNTVPGDRPRKVPPLARRESIVLQRLYTAVLGKTWIKELTMSLPTIRVPRLCA